MANTLFKRTRQAARILFKGTSTQPQKRNEIPAISAEEIQEMRQFFPRAKFFIFGHARSGTTLLARLIRLHPDVHCNYQAHFFSRAPLLESLVDRPEIESWLARRSNRWNRGRDLSPVVLRATADYILERDALREGKSVVGDKSPNSLLDGRAVELMHKVYPDARLIFIVRDGRDAVVSHRFQAFIDAERHLSAEDLRLRAAFSENPTSFLNGSRSIFTRKGLANSASEWVKNLRETDTRGRELYGEQYISLRFEDILPNPTGQMKRLWSFLGVDVNNERLDEIVNREMQSNPDADWQQQKAGDLVSPLQKGKQGSWRQLFTDDDRSAFKSIAGQALIDWRYESNLDW